MSRISLRARYTAVNRTASACRSRLSSRPSVVLPRGRHRQVFCCIMKVYLGFTVAGSRSSIEAAKKILDVLESLGHQVLPSHLVAQNPWKADRPLAPQKIFPRHIYLL